MQHQQMLTLEPGGPSILPPRVYESPSGDYRMVVTAVSKQIFRVEEVGYGHTEDGLQTAAMLGKLLDDVYARDGGRRAWLLVDYTRYRGVSNRTRREMVRRVLFHPALSGGAFFGTGNVARMVAALVHAALPALPFRAFECEEDALAWLRTKVSEAGSQPEEAAGAGGAAANGGVELQATRLAAQIHLAANGARRGCLELGGVCLGTLEEDGWSWAAADGHARASFRLLEWEALLCTLEGRFDEEAMASTLSREQKVASELALGRLTVIYDLGKVLSLSGGASKLQSAAAAARSAAGIRTIIIPGATGVPLSLLSRLRARLAGSAAWVRTARTLEEAWRLLVELRRMPVPDGARASVPAVAPPGPADDLLEQHRRSLSILLDFVGEMSWDIPAHAQALPELLPPVAEAGAVLAALQQLANDLHELLAERDRKERELSAARVAAERAARARSEFLGVVSHELRTPLAAIVGFVDLLAMSDLSAPQRHQLAAIGQAAGRLTRLVNDLLDFTRMESGTLCLHEGPFDPRATLEGVLESFSPRASAKGLTLRLSVQDDVPRWVLGDAQRFVQVVSNLLDNALKFTAKGGVELALGQGDEKPWLVLTVADTGRGISPDKLECIFQRFERSEADPGEVYPGLGLGLAITRHIAQRMGGEVGVTSRLGYGSTFTLRVPLPGLDSPLDPGAPSAPGPDETSRLRGASILLVEDDQLCRELARTELAGFGCKVTEAGDGAEALELLAMQRFDLVVLDLQLPKVDGLTVARTLRQQEEPGQRTPILVLSAHALEETRQQASSAGADAFISKPAGAGQLGRALLGLLADGRAATPARREEPEPPVPAAADRPAPAHVLVVDDEPRAAADRPAPAHVLVVDDEPRAAADRPSPAHVLVVDDEPLVSQVFRCMLEQSGFRVTCASGAKPALDILGASNGDIQLALVDRQLPGMDGSQLVNALRNEHPQVRTILVSGAPPSEEEQELHRGVPFLLKPVLLPDLVAAVRGALSEGRPAG